MYLDPEIEDEVEALRYIDKGRRRSAITPGLYLGFSVDVEKGTLGRVSYASFSGWFMVQWEGLSEHLEYRQEDLGKVLRISKPRRGRKQEGIDVAPYKGRF